MAILGSFQKQPADEWDYDIDYSQWFTDSDGFSESQIPEVTTDPEGLDVLAVIRDYENRRLKIWIGGGTDGERYKVEVTTRTREGRVRQDEFIVTVRDI